MRKAVASRKRNEVVWLQAWAVAMSGTGGKRQSIAERGQRLEF
ncbi:MAG: hypothetical protein AAF496_07075 [Pseudomonadota bacterium]